MKKIRYVNFWPGFNCSSFFFHQLLVRKNKSLTVVGAFPPKSIALRICQKAYYRFIKKSDFFITGENRKPDYFIARKYIGFRAQKNRDKNNEFRFPYWMWHLDWPELDDQPPYPRYGMRLSIDRLLRPISETYSAEQLKGRLNRAVLFSKHLRAPRRRLFQQTNHIIGCDGFGGAFGNSTQQQPKMPVMETYRYSLCPENSIGDGYITEKIPEAFHSGCVPISWCRPEDLVRDFNQDAVVNLYGLDDQQCNELLTELKAGGEYFQALIQQPLLLRPLSLKPLIEFIQS